VQDENTSAYVPQRLAKLFDLSAEDCEDTAGEDGNNPDEVKGARLESLLSSSAPLDHVLTQTLPKMLVQICQELTPLASNSIGTLLNDPAMDLAVIERLKGYAKQLSKSAGSEAEYETAIVVYYGAIAHALVHFGHKITRRPDDKLKAAFDRLGDTPWLTKDISILFKKASSACQTRLGSNDGQPRNAS